MNDKDRIAELETENKRLREALEACRRYFDWSCGDYEYDEGRRILLNAHSLTEKALRGEGE